MTSLSELFLTFMLKIARGDEQVGKTQGRGGDYTSRVLLREVARTQKTMLTKSG